MTYFPPLRSALCGRAEYARPLPADESRLPPLLVRSREGRSVDLSLFLSERAESTWFMTNLFILAIVASSASMY